MKKVKKISLNLDENIFNKINELRFKEIKKSKKNISLNKFVNNFLKQKLKVRS